jgi:hypothetical protein
MKFNLNRATVTEELLRPGRYMTAAINSIPARLRSNCQGTQAGSAFYSACPSNGNDEFNYFH